MSSHTRQLLEYIVQQNLIGYVLWYWYIDDFGMITTDFEFCLLIIHMTLFSMDVGLIHFTHDEYIKNVILV